MVDVRVVYDPNLDIWPDLRQGRVILMPSRVGVDRRTGKMLLGWQHVLQSLEVIFITPYHQRVLRRDVGSFVPHLLGELANERVITNFYWAIYTAIDLWEPNYRIERTRVNYRADGTQLTSAEDLRSGHLDTRNEGVYRPRGHLGDYTPEATRELTLVGRGNGIWEVR